MRATIAVRMPMPPMNGTGMRNPKCGGRDRLDGVDDAQGHASGSRAPRAPDAEGDAERDGYANGDSHDHHVLTGGAKEGDQHGVRLAAATNRGANARGGGRNAAAD